MEGIRQKILDRSRDWLGVKFRHQGRNRNGIDCVGLVINVHNDVFNKRVNIADYDRRPDQREVHKLMRKYLRKIKPEEALPGDIVLMAFDIGATHLGILTDQGIIHAFLQARKVVEQRKEGFRIVGYYRYPEINNG